MGVLHDQVSVRVHGDLHVELLEDLLEGTQVDAFGVDELVRHGTLLADPTRGSIAQGVAAIVRPMLDQSPDYTGPDVSCAVPSIPYPWSRWTEITSLSCSSRLMTRASWATEATSIVARTVAVLSGVTARLAARMLTFASATTWLTSES